MRRKKRRPPAKKKPPNAQAALAGGSDGKVAAGTGRDDAVERDQRRGQHRLLLAAQAALPARVVATRKQLARRGKQQRVSGACDEITEQVSAASSLLPLPFVCVAAHPRRRRGQGSRRCVGGVSG